jgi:hypothetical protein
MYTTEQALDDIASSIGRINEQLPKESRLDTAAGTVLLGPGGAESLTLVSLLVEVEEAVAARTGRQLDLVDAAVMGPDGPRFTTVGDLAAWLAATAGAA